MASSSAPKLSQKAPGSRDRILDCAVEMLAMHGFEATTMRMLGDAAGLDNSSLYRHFASKKALVDAVLDRVASDFLNEIGAHLSPARPPTLEALDAIAACAGAYFFDRPAVARLMVHWIMSVGAQGPGFDVSVPATDLSRPGGRSLALLREWLAEGARRGVLRRHAMPDAAIVLLAAMLIRPATRGYLLASMEPKRSRAAARKAWEQELRAFVRGAFAP